VTLESPGLQWKRGDAVSLEEKHRTEWFSILGEYPDDQKPDPENRLDMETALSGFLGNMWTRSTFPDIQGVSQAELETLLVQYYLNNPDAFGTAMLAAMTELADTPGGRRSATRALERLGKLGFPLPSWYGEEMRLVECWEAGDVFGDQRNYLLKFEAPSGDYGVGYSVEYSEYHFDMVVDAIASFSFDYLLGKFQQRAADLPELFFEPRQVAREDVYLGTRQSLDDWDVFCVDGDPRKLEHRFVMLRQLWKARLRMCPEVEMPGINEPGEEELSVFASGFLNHMLGKFLLEAEHFEAIRELCWFHGFNGTRVSPLRAYVFLERYLPSKYEPDDPVVRAVKRLFQPFVEWTADATGVSPGARFYLSAKTEALLKTFPGWKHQQSDIARVPRPRTF
jgi:hypothetical protein